MLAPELAAGGDLRPHHVRRGAERLADNAALARTLEYLDGADPLRLTKVTDPFGRVASLTYDADGRIETPTDVVAMTSRVAYAPDDFVQALTTPYGITAFRRASEINGLGAARRIEATHPEGGTERVEFHFTSNTFGLPASVPVNCAGNVGGRIR